MLGDIRALKRPVTLGVLCVRVGGIAAVYCGKLGEKCSDTRDRIGNRKRGPVSTHYVS